MLRKIAGKDYCGEEIAPKMLATNAHGHTPLTERDQLVG
jgi:hypothetical protein